MESGRRDRRVHRPGCRVDAEVFEDSAALVRSDNSALMFTILIEALRGSGAVRVQYQEFFARRRIGLESWLRAQRPEGVDPAIASERERDFAAALNGALIGIHLQAFVDSGSFDLDQSLRLVATMIDKNLAGIWSGGVETGTG